MKHIHRILFIQHAGCLGGSCISLLLTAKHLDRGKYEPIVALVRPSEELAAFYRNAGIETIPWPGIIPFDHSTVAYLALRDPTSWVQLSRIALGWRRSERRTIALIEETKPDLVHLNSMPLTPCATALAERGIPFVWHVREPPANGLMGVRKRFISHLLGTLGEELIFISSADRKAWVDDTRGVIVENFVAAGETERDQDQARAAIGVPSGVPVICFVGGISVAKGIFPLLEALSILRKRLPEVLCLMPGSSYQPTARWRSRLARRVLPVVGSGTLGQRVQKRIEELKLTDLCLRTPFRPDIHTWISASDLLVFPSTEPHFARPIIEAAALGKAVVASRLPGVIDLVEHEKTGLLVEANRPDVLSEAIATLLGDQVQRFRMGEEARQMARRRFGVEGGVRKIEAVYREILLRANTNHSPALRASAGARPA